MGMVETETEYACPFCGDKSTNVTRGNHFGAHRRAGDAPLPINGEVYQREDGLWDIALTLDNGDPLFVPQGALGRRSKKAAENTMAHVVKNLVEGSHKAKSKGTAKVKRSRPLAAQKGTSGLPDPEVSSAAVLAAFTKLAGVKSVPTQMVTDLSDWVTLTKMLVEGVRQSG